MKTMSKYGACPTCGQSLMDQAMLKRVERAKSTAERSLRVTLRAEIRADVEAQIKAKHAESEARLAARIDELQRQAEKRGAYDRGTCHEQDVIAALRAAFPNDRIERGGRRGDVLHAVVHRGREVGLILYECKNAGTWQNGWLAKLKSDGRKRRTPYLVLVTRKLPAKARGLCVRDDVAICEPAHAVPIALIVRQWVIGSHRAEAAAQEVPEKARRLYEYLGSAAFAADSGEIAECTHELGDQLESEREQHDRGWVRRERLQEQLRAAHLRIAARLEEEFERDANAGMQLAELARERVDPNGIANAA